MRYQIFSSSDSEILSINSMGYSKNPEIARFGPGRRNQYIIHYVISGKGFFNSQPVAAGQGFLITPGMNEHYYPDRREPWAFLWIISEDSRMKSFFEGYGSNPKTNIFEYSNIQVINSIRDYIITNNNSICTAAEMLEIFLHIFNRQYKGGLNNIRQACEKASDMYFNFAAGYIKSNLSRPLSVGEITEILGITQPYLYNIFTEKCGISPKRYISTCKFNEAKRLLTETALKTYEISNSIGYENVLDFYKFFKKMSGYTPARYREKFGAE